MEEAMLAKSKEIEQLEAKITQNQKDFQKKLNEAETTIFSLKSDNRNERLGRELEEELKKSKKNQEQLLGKIEEQESELKKVAEKEHEIKRLREQLKEEEKRMERERARLVGRV